MSSSDTEEDEILQALHRSDPAPLAAFIIANSKDAIDNIVNAFLYIGRYKLLELERAARTIFVVFGSRELEAESDSLARELINTLVAGSFHRGRLVAIKENNPFLYYAMVSGISARYRICDSDECVTLLAQGLQISGSGWEQDVRGSEREVYAIRACLALLANGKRVHDEGFKALNRLLHKFGPALKKLAEKRVIKHKNGKRLLQFTIEQADTLFVKNLDLADIWEILFPGSFVWNTDDEEDEDEDEEEEQEGNDDAMQQDDNEDNDAMLEDDNENEIPQYATYVLDRLD